MVRRNHTRDRDELDSGSKALKWVIAVVVGGIATGLTHFLLDRAKDKAQDAVAAGVAPDSKSTGPATLNPPSVGPAPVTTAPTPPAWTPPPTGGTIALPPTNPQPLSVGKRGAFSPVAYRPFDVDPVAKQAGKSVYLSQFTPFGFEAGPWQFGVGTGGDFRQLPITVQNKQYPHGLSMHPPQAPGACRVYYAIGGEFKRLKGWVGINEGGDPLGHLQFVVWGDGRLVWWSGEFTRCNEAAVLDANVSGVKTLTLETRVVRGQYNNANCVWLDPWLER
jgi:hypothetical protein